MLELDLGVPARRLRARVADEESFCSTQAGAQAVNAAVFALMSGDSQLIEVPVNPMPQDVSFDRLAPTALLSYAPLGLERDVLVVGKSTEVRRDGLERGSLLLW